MSDKPKFSYGFAFLCCVLCFMLMVATQLLGVYLLSWLYFGDGDSQTLLELGSSHGVVVAGSVWFSAMVLGTFALAILLPHTKTLANTWRFLGIRRFSLKDLCQSALLLGVLLLVGEIITRLLAKDPMAFMQTLINQQSLIAMLIAVVVIAPIYEELLFRGLLFGVLKHLKTSQITNDNSQHKNILASMISSVLFALVHLQYDTYGLVLIFVLALFFCYVRVRFGLLLAIVLHMLNNGIAMSMFLANQSLNLA